MDDVEKLPDVGLAQRGPISTEVVRRGVTNLREFARLVQKLPYGRTSDPAKLLLVLSEGRGTCSTKHALLAAIAKECSVDIQLWLGFFEMTEANTPGVGKILSAYGLDGILEAHCYLKYQGQCVDLTGLDAGPAIPQIIAELQIEPHEISGRKIALHRAEMDRWRSAMKLDFTPEELWEIREACIRELSN